MTKLTHGLVIENTHEGVKRSMSLQRHALDDGETGYLIAIITQGEDDAEPYKTVITFSEYGFDMFCKFMQNAPYYLDNFPV